MPGITLKRSGAALALGLCVVSALAGCSASTDAPAASTLEVNKQSLGESSPHVRLGDEPQEVPGYQARIATHFWNRVRMYPQNWGLTGQDAMMNPIPILPNPPSVFQPYMAEAATFYRNHQVQTGCSCTAADVGYDPMDPETREQEKFVDATCCTLGVQGGEVMCISDPVPCTDPAATLRDERRRLLNPGPAALVQEQSVFNGSQPLPAVPIAAAMPDPQAFAGSATSANNTAVAFTQVKLVNEEENVTTYELLLAAGTTIEPPPALLDGIHYQIGGDDAPNWPFEPRDTDNLALVSFAVNYYELNGDPLGTPSYVKLVLDDQCVDTAPIPLVATLPVTDEPAPFAGQTYIYSRTLSQGCHRYVFAAEDGDGFEHSYPNHGSLGVNINADGAVIPNDASCPMWAPVRPNISCLPAGDECSDGDTRPCYTGRYGTQDNGVCKPGAETCANGRWSGACEGEVRPDPVEVCNDQLDNDCDGVVNEGCEPTTTPDMGTGETDMGSGTTDMGSGGEVDMDIVITPPKDGGDSGPCGCVQVAPRTPELPLAPLALAGLGLLVARRRRPIL